MSIRSRGMGALSLVRSGGGLADQASAEQATTDEQKAASDEARRGLERRALEATEAAGAIAAAFPVAAPAAAVFVVAVGVALAIGEALITVADWIGYGNGDTPEDYARALGVAADWLKFGLPPAAYDRRWSFKGYADKFGPLLGELRANPVIADSAATIKEYAPGDPDAQATLDAAAKGYGFFFGTVFPKQYGDLAGALFGRVLRRELAGGHMVTDTDQARIATAGAAAYTRHQTAMVVANNNGGTAVFLDPWASGWLAAREVAAEVRASAEPRVTMAFGPAGRSGLDTAIARAVDSGQVEVVKKSSAPVVILGGGLAVAAGWFVLKSAAGAGVRRILGL